MAAEHKLTIIELELSCSSFSSEYSLDFSPIQTLTDEVVNTKNAKRKVTANNPTEKIKFAFLLPHFKKRNL